MRLSTPQTTQRSGAFLRSATLFVFDTIPLLHQQLLGEKCNPGARALPTSPPRGTTAILTPQDKSRGIKTATVLVVQAAKASKLKLPVLHLMLPMSQNPPKEGRDTSLCRNNREEEANGGKSQQRVFSA